MYLDSLDIGKKVCQLLGVTQIQSVTEDSKACQEITFAYDKERRSELQRNTWTFATRKALLRPVDVDTMNLAPALWDASVSYLPGAIVADANGQWWYSVRHNNLNNSPGGGNEVWDTYFGPQTVEPYDTTGTTGYFTGELVYVANGFTGGYAVFMSLINGNTDVPTTATPYSATTLYHAAAVVSYGGSLYKSTSELNLGITPFDGSQYLPFDATATYSAGQEVTGSDNQLYTSVGNGNIGHNPVTDAGVHWTPLGYANAWTKLPASTVVASTNWRVITCNLHNLVFNYPIGAGPASSSQTKNVYKLPAGYLKTAPDDPKMGSTSYMGAPSGAEYKDWDYEGDYIVTQYSVDPIILRFVADITKVRDMHDMFCKGLACSIATQTCETITQSTGKMQSIASQYKLFMGEARTVNAIEAGPTEPPEDDWIACRA